MALGRYVALVTLVLTITSAASSAAQGNQTGNLGGTVRDSQGLAVPGATVRVVSPAQQGERQTMTDGLGAYLLPGLPTGRYAVTVELSGFQTVTSDVDVALGSAGRLDVSLRPAAATETVTVVATPSPLTRATSSFNIKTSDVERLPIGRTPSLVAEFAPGLTNNTPNVNQVTINGALAYDSAFLMDGGLEWMFAGGVAVIEWAERAGSRLPEETLRIHLAHDPEDPDRRLLRAEGLT